MVHIRVKLTRGSAVLLVGLRTSSLVLLAVTPVFSRASAQLELDILSVLKEFHDLRQMLPRHLKARANKILYECREKVSSWSGADE